MAKFPTNPIAQLYSGDNCYVTIAALIVISQSSYSLLSWGLGHLRCLVSIRAGVIKLFEGGDGAGTANILY